MSVPLIYIPNLLPAQEFTDRLDRAIDKLERVTSVADERNKVRLTAKHDIASQLAAKWAEVRATVQDENSIVELYKGYTKFRWEMRQFAGGVKHSHETGQFERDVADGQRAGLLLIEDLFRSAGLPFSL